MSATMTCQKCRSPLRVDSSIDDLSSASFDLLAGPSTEHERAPNANWTGPGISSVTTPQPLRTQLDYPATRKEFYDRVSKNNVLNVRRTGAGPIRTLGIPQTSSMRPGDESMSFVMLTESQFHPAQLEHHSKVDRNSKVPQLPETTSPGDDPEHAVSKKLEANQRLFEVISSRTDIDHPICAECTEILISCLQVRLNAATKEREAYVSYLKEMKNSAPTAEELTQAEKELKESKTAQEKSMKELLALEREKSGLENEMARLDTESRELDKEEEAFWRTRNITASKMAEYLEDRDALQAAYEYDGKQLERLQRTNVYNDTFCISHDGNFGTINGLRLGRLPPPNHVEWTEINAAWGSSLLLLATVADKLGFSFRNFRLRPMGSSSHIDKIELTSGTSTPKSPSTDRTVTRVAGQQHRRVTALELFSSGDLPVARAILHRRFNDAMVAFLECMRQLGDFVETGDPTGAKLQREAGMPEIGSPRRASGGVRGLKLPYKIEKDKIHGPKEIVARIQRNHPKLKITYRQLTAAPFAQDQGLPDEIWRDATIVVTLAALPPTPEAAPNLELIQVFSAGTNHLEKHPIYTGSKIPIASSSGIHGPTIAEWVIMTTLVHTRHYNMLHHLQNKHNWGSEVHGSKSPFRTLRDQVGQRLGVLGYGSIGRQAARVFHAMGMEVIAYTASPRETKESKKDSGFIVPGTGDPDGDIPVKWFSGKQKEDLHHFLGQDIDFLIVSVPLTKATTHLLGKEEFEILSKRNTFVSNISRGQIIDQSALTEALKVYHESVEATPLAPDSLLRTSRPGIRGAALDVTDPEPLPQDDPLWDAPNCIITPHISGLSAAYSDRAFQVLEVNLDKKAKGEPLINIVDRDRGY